MEKSSDLAQAAQTGDIAALYALLKQNAYLLEVFDNIPFVDTPLHTAASAGCTHFAIEILSLRPSFAKKLNQDGYSPIDLALTSRQRQTVKQLIRFNPELIHIKSKERFTPLHYVAKMDDDDLLAEFLVRCPKSIEDLTVRGETAVHIAVRNGKMSAFKVLLGWLSEANLEQILNWQDDKGDTVLHIATSTNDLEAVKLLIKKMDITIKNQEGLTALDIDMTYSDRGDDIREILRSTSNSKESFKTRMLRTLNPEGPVISGEAINAVLVVLGLIVTVTYQSLLSPPGGITSGADDNSKSNTTGTEDLAGNTQMGKKEFYGFLFLNSAAFFASMMAMIGLLKKYITNDLFLQFLSASLSASYTYSAWIIAPATLSFSHVSLTLFMAFLAPIAVALMCIIYYRSRV